MSFILQVGDLEITEDEEGDFILINSIDGKNVKISETKLEEVLLGNFDIKG